MKGLMRLKPIRRCLVEIGGRKGKLRHHQAYYNPWTQKIVLNFPFYFREKHVEANVEDNIEHETLHHVLGQRISSEASHKFDNFPYMGSLSEGSSVYNLQIVKLSNNPKSKEKKE